MITMLSERKNTGAGKAEQRFVSRFIPSEQMPGLIEKIRKIEEKHSDKPDRIREKKAINTYYLMALKEGLGGQLKKSFRGWLLFGVPFYMVFTGGQKPETLVSAALMVGFGSLVTANILTYSQIKKDVREIRTMILESNLKE